MLGSVAERENLRLRRDLVEAQVKLSVVEDLLRDKTSDIGWLRRKVDQLTETVARGAR